MNKSFIKTRPCQTQLTTGSCTNKSCTYAHSLEELKHLECNFGDKCTKKETICNFKHPSETNEEFRKRTHFVEPVFVSALVVKPQEVETASDDASSSVLQDVVHQPPEKLPPFVLCRNDKMSHVVSSMAVLMKRDVVWINSKDDNNQ